MTNRLQVSIRPAPEEPLSNVLSTDPNYPTAGELQPRGNRQG